MWEETPGATEANILNNKCRQYFLNLKLTFFFRVAQNAALIS